MAAGPFLGAAILAGFHPETVLAGSPLEPYLAPAWRWVFFVNIPIGIAAAVVGWAAAADWDTPRRPGRVDLPGAALYGVALTAGLVALTLLGATTISGSGIDPTTLTIVLTAVAVVATVLAITRALRTADPFIDVRLFRRVPFSSAAIVSALTGYAFATAIIGAAVFVDRVLYGGPDEQRLALGALAGATAVGALVSGWLVRGLGPRLVSLVGIGLAVGGLLWMATWTAATPIGTVAAALATFGLGFGLTVTPRSSAAIELAGPAAYGQASSTVTVARMLGMAVGLAILTAYGSTTIDRLSAQVYATPEAYQAVIPPELRDRPLRDPLVVEALEAWASREAASIMVGLFLVAAIVTIVAIPPSFALGGRSAPQRTRPREDARMLTPDGTDADPAH